MEKLITKQGTNIGSLLSSNNMDWETPQDFFDKLNEEFHFDLDPCCHPSTAKCENYFTPKEDGLVQDWSRFKAAFVNPPYGRAIGRWVAKCYRESLKGVKVVMLIPSRTDTAYFHDYIYGKAQIRFIRGRLKFRGYNTKGELVQNQPLARATFPSMIVIYDSEVKSMTDEVFNEKEADKLLTECADIKDDTPAEKPKHDPGMEAMFDALVGKTMREEHAAGPAIHVSQNITPDSIKIGTPAKGGEIKVYGNANNPDGFREKIKTMIELRKEAEAALEASKNDS